MSDGTPIEWTDATLNVVNGCSVVSPGCTNCYAMRSGGRNLPWHPATGLTKPSKAGHVWTGEVRFNDKALLQPLRWKRARKIFWNAHGDLFHEAVPDEWIDRCFAVMALTPHHIHQVLTKRPERMRDYVRCQVAGGRHVTDEIARIVAPLGKHGYDTTRLKGAEEQRLYEANCRAFGQPMPNVWLGVSVEDQQRADERIPILLDTPAAVRWLSCEPLLGPVDLDKLFLIPTPPGHTDDEVWAMKPLAGRYGIRMLGCGGDADWLDGNGNPYPRIDWVVAGGESGAGARPMHPDWARSLRDQCADARVPFLFKQWGEWLPCEVDAPGDGTVVCYPDDGSERDMAEIKGARAIDRSLGREMWRVGKKAAGRLLDGVQHDGYPV